MLFEVPEILNGAMDFDSFYFLLRREKNPIVLRILYYIYDLYCGFSVPDTSKKHRITKETGYKYARIWRTKGIEGLFWDYHNGNPSKMNDEEWKNVLSQIRDGKVHNVEDLVNFILKNFKKIYSKSWAYELFRNLSLEDGIKYPLSPKEKKTEDKIKSVDKNQYEIFFNEEGLECVKVSKKLYFTRYDDINLLNDLIDSEKNNKLLKRYIFINCLNNGFNLEEARIAVNTSISTARKWLKLWNEHGIEGLKIKWGDGRPSFLTHEQKSQVKEHMRNNHVTRHSEVHKYILENFNVNYSLDHIYRFIKKN